MNLDIKLLGKAIQCHGLGLVDKIKEEQQTEPSSSLMSYLDRRRPVETTEENNEMFMENVRSFIARKSDMLFKPVEAAGDESKSDGQDNEEVADVYAIMPPLETFMSVPSSIRRDHFYDSLSTDDCVTGVVTAVLDTGLLVRLLCVDVGPSRDMDGLDVTAYCPAKELPRLYAKESALDAFQENDIVRGIVLSVNPEAERIILSLHEKSIPQEKTYPRIGLITEEEFPVHYRRKSEAKNKDYEDILESVMGFNNVGNIKALVQRQGFTEIQSFTRSLSWLNIPKMEYAEGLKKWQSQKMAHQSVALGVGMFKDGKYIEAMQHFNKALQIDEENVEALVARGALFANKENFDKAVTDFRQALSINATHSNARNYLIETLLTMGKLQEDDRRLEEACKHYQEVLEIDPNHAEAKDILAGCQKLMAFQKTPHVEEKSLEMPGGRRLSHSNDDSDPDSDVDWKSKKKSVKAQSSSSILSKSTEKLLQLIKEDESKMGRSKKRKKHKRSTDHSSPEKEESKKRKKKRTASREDKMSSSDSDSHERPKSKFKQGRMRSSSPDDKRLSSTRIKDKSASFQESDWVTARLQSPIDQTSSESFLPFSSNRFFNKATIPGLGSPPPSDANLQHDQEMAEHKSFHGAMLASPRDNVEKDSGTRPGLNRRDSSFLMEERKKFYEKEMGKAPSLKWKQQHSRSSSPSSSSSSSSSSSPERESRKGRGRRRRSESLSPRQRKRRRHSSRSRSRSRSKSRSSSKSQSGSYKEMGSVKKRTGVAELDMYLGGGTSSEAIMALLRYGSKSSNRSPSYPQNSSLQPRSPRKRVRKSRSESRSPVSHRSDRSLSRSSGQMGQDKKSAESLSRRKSQSRSRSRESSRPYPQHSPPRSGQRSSRERKMEDNKKDLGMVKGNRPMIDSLEKTHEVEDRRKSEKRVLPRGDFHQNKDRLSDLQKDYSGGGGGRSSGFKEEVKPQSRPFLPRVVRKAAMDNPDLMRRTVSSKEYDAFIREERQKKEKNEASWDDDEMRKSKVKNESKDKESKDTGNWNKSNLKSPKHEWPVSRKDRRELEEGHRDYHLEWKEISEKNQNELKSESDKLYKKSKNDSRERSASDKRIERRGRGKSDESTDSRDIGKSDEKDDFPLKKTILMAPEDLEKEIERRVQERLKEEEKKEKEKKAKESSYKKEKEPSDIFYVEQSTGWTEDSYGKNYFALKGKRLPAGYHKDKFGKMYYVGINPTTNKAGVNQKLFTRNNSEGKDFGSRKGIRSPHRRDSRTQGKSTPRERDYQDYGRPSLSSSKGSPNEDRDVDDERKQHKSHEKTAQSRSKSKIRSERASDSDDGDSESKTYDSRRCQRTGDEGREDDPASTSSTGKEPGHRRSRWDEEDSSTFEKMAENSGAKRKKISAESLTDLEKFLSSLKQRKKEQWIAEGKIKEKE